MSSMLKISLCLVAVVALVSVATLADAGTGIGGKPGGAVYGGYTQYRAYSYEPAPMFSPGQMVVVAKAKAELKLGDKVLTTVGQGAQFKILQTQGTWIGVNVEQNGKKIAGWIAQADLSTGPVPAPASR